MTLKDKLVLWLVKFIQHMGYCFYIRNSVDNPVFNGNDIAMFKFHDAPVKIIALCTGVRQNQMYEEYPGKV